MNCNNIDNITNLLITGGAGFIGANLVRYVLKTNANVRVINLDKLTYAGNLNNLSGIGDMYGERYVFVEGDICDEGLLKQIFVDYRIDTVIHLAAESHVDRSIDAPLDFVRTNVLGTGVLLEVARWAWADNMAGKRFHHVSTDEVYGSLGEDGYFMEDTSYDPSSPYSASKASSDHLVRAWGRTYGLPITISNCSNNYGPYQFPEKLLPLMICNALQKKDLPVYGDGKNVRDWLYVEDHCRAIYKIVCCGQIGTTYNVGGHNEWSNIDIVRLLCSILDQLRPSGLTGGYGSLIKFVTDRPGHDRRYAIDAGFVAKKLGWLPKETFETGLRKTVIWYLENQAWLDNIWHSKYCGTRLGCK